jgi:transcription factor E
MAQKIQLKATKKLTEEVITELVGEHALPIIDFLRGKTKISEFIIAEELDMEINETRTILYKLLEHNIVTFIRKKDRIKGWYICYWDLNEHMVPQLRRKMDTEKLEKLESRLESEQSKQFFMCRSGCSRMDFDEGMENEFACGECGGILQPQDNSRTVEFLKDRIGELKKSLN